LIDLGYDSGPLNDSVPTENIDTVSYLNVSRKQISNLTGIEDFIELDSLDCSFNQIARLDLSNNQALLYLNCFTNLLTSLDIDNNPALELIIIENNLLGNLDVTKNLNLKELYCSSNPLKSLDLTQNPKLTRLGCISNQLTSLDISNNISIDYLYCPFNELTNLDVSNNTALRDLSCYSNKLTNLVVSNNPELTVLACWSNNLSNLDISDCPKLGLFNAKDNPNLYCIEVMDSSQAANNPNWQKDATAIYSEDCSTVSVNDNVNDMHDISVSPNPASDYIEINVGNRHACSLQENLKIYNSLGECVLTPLAFGEGTGVRLDVSPLAPGLYFVTFNDETGLFIKY
jgi:hypothetical protein